MFRNSGTIKRAERAFIRQRDQADCGVACLASVVAYCGGEAELERLRALSGTSRQGTTLLGLHQAAQALGLEAGAYEAGLDDLEGLEAPCILHIIKDRRLQHYVVCYGYEGGRFVISDPADGVRTWTEEALAAAWQSRALLLLEPAAGFVRREAVRRDKWAWLRRLVEADLHVLGLALALGLAISVLSLSMAVFTQKLIDDILPSEARVELVAGLVLLAFLLIAKNGLSYIRQRFLIEQRRDFNNRVIGHFYGSLLRLPRPFFHTRKAGDLIARMNDSSRLQQAVAYIIGDVMIDVLLLVAAAAFIFYYSAALGALVLLSVPLFAGLAARYHRPILEGQRQVMAAHAANESNYVDTIQGIATIKASNREGWFSALTQSVYRFFQDQIYRLGRVGIGFNFWAETVNTLLIVAVLAWSAFLVLDGELQLGMMVAVLQMAGMLIPAAMRLALTNLQLQEARVAFDRMHEFTSLEPEYEARETRAEPPLERFEELEVRHLSFRFAGRQALLKDLSFRIRRGEIVGFLGESGSGKTTLLEILQRFYMPEAGRLVLNGTHPWKEVPTAAWRDWIGVVPQQVKIFNASLLENICLGNAAEEAEAVVELCRTCGLERFFLQFPQGYATLLGEEGINISGGQRQLVALARALYRRPQLLLLDEATASMDREMEQAVLGLLQRLKSDMAVVLVTHRIQSAQHADRIYVVEKGRIQTEGTPQELAAGDNLFSRSLMDLSLS